MINIEQANKYCKDDISKIENYEKAIADTTQTWHCHHIAEIKVLPSGITVIRSIEELKEDKRYYNCPANELIFLTPTEHLRLHKTGQARSYETRQKIAVSRKGRTHTEETRQKIADAHKGKTYSEESRKKMSESQKGKTRSEETRRKIGEARKGKHLSDETRRKMSEAKKRKIY